MQPYLNRQVERILDEDSSRIQSVIVQMQELGGELDPILEASTQALHRRQVTVSARVDASEHWQTVWKAVQCHKTQMTAYSKLAELSDEYHKTLWGAQEFYRAFSIVNGGREVETDLFAGIR